MMMGLAWSSEMVGVGRSICTRLRELIPREQFKVPIAFTTLFGGHDLLSKRM
jgi:translation elongation factor EF-4